MEIEGQRRRENAVQLLYFNLDKFDRIKLVVTTKKLHRQKDKITY